MKNAIRYLWEALLALYLGFLATMAAMAKFTVLAAFGRLETRVNAFLHIRQTDLISGYFALWIPSTACAALIWLVLRLSARARLTQEFLRLAGILIIAGPFEFWVGAAFIASAEGRAFWPVGWVHGAAPFEMVAAIGYAALFLSGRWQARPWPGVVLICAHYVFWYFAGMYPYGIPIPLSHDPVAYAPPLGVCAAVAWGAYVNELRRPGTFTDRGSPS